MSSTPTNPYLSGPLGPLYARTALPIIFVMGMNGLLTVADALFLGHFVGARALAAVTLMFPLFMLVVALATLVASGMSSILARRLGAEDSFGAQSVFAGAHGLALLLAAGLIALDWVFGPAMARLAAGGDAELARMGTIYLGITVGFSPLMFVLSVNVDALRNEGRVGLMAAMSLLVSLANIGFNYVLIAGLGMGVAGSAYGTAAAQGLALAIIVVFRLFGQTGLRPDALIRHGLRRHWGRILALGAPQSLNFLGLALGSAAIMAALQWRAGDGYGATVSAYGIVTRVMTFAFLPLLGLGQAMQSITGTNHGARRWDRADQSLRIALVTALAYCATVQVGMSAGAHAIGAAFVADPAVIATVGRILPVILAMFFLAGPLMMIATYFQTIGDAPRAALLGLAKPYLFAIPLTFGLAAWFGEPGIWRAGPVAELLLLALTAAVLSRRARQTGLRLGLFHRDERHMP